MANLYEKTCKAFNNAKVDYLVIGGFAVNFYGYNRSTGDLDFFVNPEHSNIERLLLALKKMGYETEGDLTEAIDQQQLIRFSDKMHTVELLFAINLSNSFSELLKNGVKAKLGKQEVCFISYDDLIAEKVKSQRPKDLNDVVELQKLR